MNIQYCRSRQCHNTVGTYTCDCRQGFETIMLGNEYACVDIDECTNEKTCPETAVCQNREGDYTCICETGYEGQFCLDVDECSIENTKCDQNADCYNTPGSFECACRKGFFGTGLECVKGQCQDSVCADNKKCTSLTTINCMCKAGFADGVNDTCVDLDECLRHTNNCHDQADCINLPGSYSCECEVGFYGTGRICLEGDCKDSDCPANEQCITPRRSDCECKEGFYRNESEKCVDIDECENINNCTQNSACSNTEGSYYCNCKPGFYGSGFTTCFKGECVDASCPGNQTCMSPTTTCDCSEGLNKIGKNCFDIDECGLNIYKCPKKSSCVNSIGSYICDCFFDYTDDNCQCRDGFDEQANGTCTDVDECVRGTHDCPKNSTCVNVIGNRICDIDECDLGIHNCSSELECVNTDGDFSCEE